MFKIRSCTFETNSSSVHSIVIDVSCEPIPIEDEFECYGGEFGWGYLKLLTPEERCDYLWQAIWSCAEYLSIEEACDLNAWRDRICQWIPNATLADVPEKLEDEEWWFPGIDHGGELIEMLEVFWEEPKFLGYYLTCPESHVICSSDGSDSYGFEYPESPYIEYIKGN